MALGVDADGREVKPSTVQAAITPLLRDKELTSLDKIRLLMMYVG